MIRYGKRLAKKTPFNASHDDHSERAWWDVQYAVHEQVIESLKDEIAGMGEEIENKDAVIIDLRGDLEEARSELKKTKRLHGHEFYYDKNAVAGFTAETASNAVGIASRLLDSGCKIPFGVACAVVLKRELDAAKSQIEDLARRLESRPNPKAEPPKRSMGIDIPASKFSNIKFIQY